MSVGNITHPYFLGIGGIGMSALAQHYLNAGCQVGGYDRVATPLTRKLEAMGARIHYTEDPSAIDPDVDVVIYTPAIPPTHSEWGEIRRRKLPVYKRSEVLGRISREHITFAVAGTHGKTTTSALLAFLLRESVGCNAILGGIAVDFDGNYHFDASSPFLVTEADEYDRSFLQLHPAYSAVTAWDADHLDIYGTLENMRQAYRQFMAQSGYCIVDARVKQTEGQQGLEDIDGVYGMDPRPGQAIDAYACNLRVEEGHYRFDYMSGQVVMRDLGFSCPGRHNVENAVAAVSLALKAGVSQDDIRRALPLFRGVKRRLEKISSEPGYVYFDDYAHHPAEIEASIKALREFYPQYALYVMFQPHLYTRTRDLADGFARSLSMVDRLCLVDIYPARELPIEGVDTHLIGDRIKGIKVDYTGKEGMLDWVRRQVGDHPFVLVTMGAGDIDTMVEPLARMLGREGGK